MEVNEGNTALFALLSNELNKLSIKYKKDIEELMNSFFNVNCNREKMIKFLEGCKDVKLWTPLEDIAIIKKDSEEYKVVEEDRGEDEVEERRKFLEIA